jgi:type II secretory pathway pseudopilin PulG
VSGVQRLRSESGTSIVELLTAMTILGTVVGALTGLFVTGVKSQVDLSDRVQAQNGAVTALSRIRRDVNCASAWSGGSGATSMSLTTTCVAGGTVSWCTTQTATNRYALRRRATAGTCGTGDPLVADWLRTGSVFAYQDSTTGGLLKSKIRATLEMRAPKMRASYTLCDVLVLRNSTPTLSQAVLSC